jgi:DNA replication licensing factor MCM6
MRRNEHNTLDGVTGLKKIGVKDLSYKIVFIASSVKASDSRFGITSAGNEDDDDEVDIDKEFTLHEKHMIQAMKNEDNLYTKLA